MATDPLLLDRIRNSLSQRNIQWEELRMFGGDCFMVDDKMLMGIYQGQLMARVNPDEKEKLISQNGAEQMMHGGRTMSGFIMIKPIGFDLDHELEFWIDKCLEFNPLAKKSKKK